MARQQEEAAQQMVEAAQAARAEQQRSLRRAEAQREKVKATSSSRLQKRRALEEKVADLQTEVEELRTQLCEGSELRRARDDAYAKVQAMPT